MKDFHLIFIIGIIVFCVFIFGYVLPEIHKQLVRDGYIYQWSVLAEGDYACRNYEVNQYAGFNLWDCSNYDSVKYGVTAPIYVMKLVDDMLYIDKILSNGR